MILARRAGGPRDARSADARSADPRRRSFWALALPPAIALALFLVAPVVFMGALSFRDNLSGTLLGPFEPTLRHYAKLFDTPVFLRSLGVSALTAFGVAAAATILAYPLAYYLTFRAGRRAALYLILLLVPFWTSYLLRVMAWKLMLGGEGVINSVLIWAGVVTEPIAALLYNRGAVIVTLIYVWIPFATLPILAALGRVDVRLHEAAADLYASPLQQFRRVTLPLSLPGVFAAFLMVFIPTVGEYVTPLLVGGTGGTMYGNIIHDFFTRAANWPYGSALAMVMFAATIVLVAIGLRVVNPRRLLER